MVECQALLSILDTYEQASGQKLNYEKTSLFFSTNTPQASRNAICSTLSTTSTGDLGKYLGLPSIIGRGKKQAFTEIKQKVARKLHGWKGKMLSQAGKEILIKSVVQAIPVYTMSCFCLPDSFCNEINSMVSNFWWGQRNTERKIHWQKWSKLCRNKVDGGMGFRDLSLFNQALLAKQGWRLLQNSNTLLHKVLKAKYFPNCSFMEAKIPSHSSYSWRSLAQARHVIRRGTRWRIGNGSEVSIWRDKWINSMHPCKILSPRQILPDSAMVSDLVDPESNQWKEQLIDSIFWPEEAAQIKSIPMFSTRSDSLVWMGTPTGTFTTRSAYHMLAEDKNGQMGSSSNPERLHAFWKSIWRVNVPHKIRVFMWRACSSCLPTKTSLFTRGVTSFSLCPICLDEAETMLHSLWDCGFAKECWQNSPLSHIRNALRATSWIDLVGHVLMKSGKLKGEVFFVLAWMIWGCRNDAWLNQSYSEASKLGAKAVTYVEEYLDANKRVESMRPIAAQKWLPPPPNCVKLNVAWKKHTNRTSFGVGSVIRDDASALLAAHCEVLPQAGDDIQMAATSVITALSICQEAGFRNVMVEFSHSQLKALILSKEECLTELHESIDRIRHFQLGFCFLDFHVIPGSCNRAANSLAIHAKEASEPSVWLEEGLAVLLPIVIADLP
uniref:Reverse transcriptase zinc-binding domain-containing protein n=1 Tax=Fagus sylvatica TaxID=28930 RepID=A0A2N9GQD2_FAGSY